MPKLERAIDLPKTVPGGLGFEPRPSESNTHTLNPMVVPLPQKWNTSQQRDGETAYQRRQDIKIVAQQEICWPKIMVLSIKNFWWLRR